MRLGDENLQFGEKGVAVLRVKHLLEFDRFQVMGPGTEATHLTLDTVYQARPGRPTRIVPLTSDPLSPNNWAGTIWDATAKGTFSVTYDDGTFSVTGTMDSALATEGTPGHMGFERNGVFTSDPQDQPIVHHHAGPVAGTTHRLQFVTR